MTYIFDPLDSLDSLDPPRADMVRLLQQRLEHFCSTRPLRELNVVFHSTGVNYAHQFYVLSMLGRDRLRQFNSVNFVSGSVIAAIVYYSFKTGHLEYGQGDAALWERNFFASHGLRPVRSAFRVPYLLARGRPLLTQQAHMDVIRGGIGKEFADYTVDFFPENFRFWLYDQTRRELTCAMADNHLNSLKLIQLAMAATAVPLIFHPFEIGDFSFVDPVFSPERQRLATALKQEPGPTLVSNMVIDRGAPSADFVRPHLHARGRILMLRELLQFCLGVSNRDHLEGLERGLVHLGSRVD